MPSTAKGLLSAWRVLGDTLDDPVAFRERIASRDLQAGSLIVALTRASNLCRYLGLPDVTEGIKRPRRPKRAPKPFTDEEVRILMDALQAPYRDWLVLACWAGLRCMEVSAARGEDLQLWQTGWKLRVAGKGGTILTVPAHPNVVEVFSRYGTDDRLWPDTTAHTVSRRFRDACERVGMPGGHLHRGRHTYGTALYRNTKDILTVQQLMRHQQISSTVGYIGLDDAAAAQAVATL